MSDHLLKPSFGFERELALSIGRQRLLVGLLGLFLVPLVYVLSAAAPLQGFEKWAPLASVSQYYYSSGGAVFIGIMAALAITLSSYSGYTHTHWDQWLGRAGGVFATVVAILPTDPPHKDLTPTWWQPWMGTLHTLAAGLLLIIFIVFSLALFPRSTRNRQHMGKRKHLRNRIYISCGILTSLGVLGSLAAARYQKSIFLPETLAVASFAVAWIVKSGWMAWLEDDGRSAAPAAVLPAAPPPPPPP